MSEYKECPVEIQSDYHCHTNFSVDSTATPKSMIEAAIAKELKILCITDHYDRDCPEESVMDIPTYLGRMKELQKKYKKDIDLRIGIEIGMQPQLEKVHRQITGMYPFDFVIGSVHMVEKADPYYPEFFQNRTDEEAYRKAFVETIKDMESTDFDVLGHIDYVVRYGMAREKSYSYEKFADVIDPILRYVIEHGKGIELNTSGFKYGLGFCHPHPDVIKRYRDLGGEIITIGSDGHKPEHLAYDFEKVPEILQNCGFRYYTIYKERKPEFVKLR